LGVKSDVRQRAHDKIARAAGQGLDLVGFWRACTPVLAEVVPHYHAPCWHTLDPASLLITSHFDEGIPEVPAEWLVAEYLEDDVNKLADVARTERGCRRCTRSPAATRRAPRGGRRTSSWAPTRN
jgi:hypothetical protein